MSTRVHLTAISRNAKTGPIPVSTSAAQTCPPSCPLKANGCYADGGPLALLWRKVTADGGGMEWPEFLAKVRKLPKGQLWRHNQAGDLPGNGDALDVEALGALVRANAGRNGFTYTHKPLALPAEREAVASANARGFTVNLSANDLAHADELAALGCGPVAVVLPHDQMRPTVTPAGRAVAICPAVLSDSVTCASCGLCASTTRKAIIGFPAHGPSKRKASRIAGGAF